jgi:hypothetical protein
MNSKYHVVIKKAGFFSWFVVALMTIGPAFSFASATESNLNNDTTGSNSENTNRVDQEGSFSFTIENYGDSENNINLDLNTGGNSISNNTVVGDITTGDVGIDASVENNINQSEITVPDMSSDPLGVESENILTGPNSENDNLVNIDNKTNILIKNTSSTKNDIDLRLNTGNNEISGNTVVGDITTGRIRVSIGLVNNLNGKGTGPIAPPSDPVTPPLGPAINPPSITTTTTDVAIAPPGAGAGIIEAATSTGVPVGEAFFAAGQTAPYILYIILIMGISYILFGEKLQLKPIASK